MNLMCKIFKNKHPPLCSWDAEASARPGSHTGSDAQERCSTGPTQQTGSGKRQSAWHWPSPAKNSDGQWSCGRTNAGVGQGSTDTGRPGAGGGAQPADMGKGTDRGPGHGHSHATHGL